ncbi:MAG: hypothetical protein IH859_10520 [Chloroflexi bacterium]|nr:hypothetical protein [Chloroflexota bacterium]
MLASFLLAAVGLEAAFQIFRTIWDENVRKEWNFTRLLMVIVAITAVTQFSEWNVVSRSGLDLGQEFIGKVITALALARVTQWVHNLFIKTALRG